jgi:hypothetical protein
MGWVGAPTSGFVQSDDHPSLRVEERRRTEKIDDDLILSLIRMSLIILFEDDLSSSEMIEFFRFRLFRSFIFEEVAKMKDEKESIILARNDSLHIYKRELLLIEQVMRLDLTTYEMRCLAN